MPPIRHSEQEESAFMNDLLSGIDDSFFSAVPSPDPSPRKRKSSGSKPTNVYRTPTKPKHSRNKKCETSPFKHTSPAGTIVSTPKAEDLAQLLDGAEDWDWDDMNSDFLTPKKPRISNKFAFSDASPNNVGVCSSRCVIKDIVTAPLNGCYEKTLLVHVIPGNELKRVILRDDWIDTDVRAGDIVNVIGSFTTPTSSSSTQVIPTVIICSKANFLIHHPDLLITATSLSNAPQCRRKPLLSNLVRTTSDVTPSLVWGNMLHEVMQTCMIEGCWDERWVDQKITEVVSRGLAELLRIGIGVSQAKREVKERASGLKAFSQRYISQVPKPDAVLTNTRAVQGQKSLLAISKLHDIEEDIWSPTYGLKGKLDASVQAKITETGGNDPFSKAAKCTTKSWNMPFEIKTGRAIAGMEHRAQTMLYTLLMAERYKTEVPSGLLYYTQSEEVVRVPAARNELKALVMARNEMAGYMMRRMKQKHLNRVKVEPGEEGKGDENGKTDVEIEVEPFLPPTIDDSRLCGRCYTLDICMLYRKAVENVVDETSEIADMYALKTSHLTPSQSAFFKKWEALIAMEEQDLVRFKKELWTMGAQEREEHGRCFSNMVLDLSYQNPTPTPLKATARKEGKIRQFTYKFIKAHSEHSSLLNGHMSVGDAITVSVEPDLLALSRGFITELAPQHVVVGVDHDISLEGIHLRRHGEGQHSLSAVVFRIDKDELYGGMGRIRDNLTQLFYVDGDTRRLELVVDLAAPRFEEWDGPIVPEDEPVYQDIMKLNADQQQAMKKALSAQDYTLILGMPGTGKTTVIAMIIRALVCMGKSVLLTSYTHSAVDTILLKLKDDVDFGILRLGNLDKVHPDVHKFTLGARREATSIEQLEHQVMTPPVVATTCLSIDHALFSRRKFDYCIVDEASQVTLPTCLGPLRFADKFVLVGDHFQLPPLVRNRDARRGGLEISLFRRLSDAHPSAVIDLTEQYRMNEDIMLLSNELIYGNRLRCGSAEVAKRGLRLPNPDYLRALHAKSTCDGNACWMERLLDENCKAIFVDTDAVPAQDSRIGDLVQNVTEARLVHLVAESLLRSGVTQRQIGVISLYRQQIKLLSYLLQDRKDIDILTADRSQGRDKDCIIISMVRSNDLGQIGDLMKDWRRMNVSFTRARAKLIIFGSRKTLQAESLLREFFTLMDNRGWILRLPPGADKIHDVPMYSSPKRSAEDVPDLFSADVKENTERPQKRTKKTAVSEDALLKGRPLLKDLMNARK